MQVEYKTLYAQIVHNKTNGDAINAPKRFAARLIAQQQSCRHPRRLLTSKTVSPAARALNKMMKSRFTNGKQLCIQLAIPVA
jgi:hypothetical protein